MWRAGVLAEGSIVDRTADQADGGVDTGQLLLVTLCLIGLVVAAFLAPVSAQVNLLGGNASGSGGGGGTPTGVQATDRPDSGEPGTAPASGSRTPQQRSPGGDGGRVLNGTRPVPIPGDDGSPVSGCGVLVENKPVPGREISVRVYQDLRPAADTRVWFNDEFAGRTNATGSVTAQVPYERQLNVTVESSATDPCEFFRREYEDDRTRRVGNSALSNTVGSGPRSRSERLVAVRDPARQTQSGDGNSTGGYEVYGTATVRIDGRAYPGSTVVVTAAIDDVPMRQANVTVDGERVGRTNDSGAYALTVPDTDTVTVEVTRGEYTGGVTVDVLQLSLQFTAADPFVVPGDRTEVTARLDDAPARNGTVRLDGRELGTTGENGTVGFRAPVQLSGAVTATTEYQTERVPVYRAFAGTILTSAAVLVLSVVSTGLTARYRGLATAKRVAGGWAAISALFVAFAIWEWPGAAVGGGVLAVAVLYRLRSAILSGAEITGGLLAALLDMFRHAVVKIVGAIERLADWTGRAVRRLVAWIGTLPRSLSGLARRLGHCLRQLPGTILGVLGRFSARRVGAAIAIVAFLFAAAQVGGVYGFLGAAALVAVGLFGWWYWQRSSEEPETEAPGSTVRSAPAQPSESVPTLRELWRRLARWVSPDSWRTSTPTEITQAAVDRGLPRAPVESLADAFRDVEYGGESSMTYREQAREAFEALKTAREDDG